MKTVSLHRQYNKQVAKAPACMSAYWSQFSIELGNDRTPEISGFLEDSVS